MMALWSYDPMAHLKESLKGTGPGSYFAMKEAMEKVIMPWYKSQDKIPDKFTFENFYKQTILDGGHSAQLLEFARPKVNPNQDKFITDFYFTKRTYKLSLKAWIDLYNSLGLPDLARSVKEHLDNPSTWNKFIEDDEEEEEDSLAKGRQLSMTPEEEEGDESGEESNSQNNEEIEPYFNFDPNSPESLTLFRDIFLQS